MPVRLPSRPPNYTLPEHRALWIEAHKLFQENILNQNLQHIPLGPGPA